MKIGFAGLWVLAVLGCDRGLQSHPGAMAPWSYCGSVGASAVDAVWMANGSTILLDADKKLELYDAELALSRTFPPGLLTGVLSPQFDCTVARNGLLMACANYDTKAVDLWSLSGGVVQGTLPATSEHVRHLELSPDNQLLLAASWDKAQVELWRLASSSLVRTHPGGVARFVNDGAAVAVWAESSGKLTLYSTADGSTIEEKPPVLAQVTAISPDASMVIRGMSEQDVGRTVDGSTVMTSAGALQFSADGNLITDTDFMTRRTTIRRAADGTAVGSFAGTLYAWSPDGKYVAVLGDQVVVRAVADFTQRAVLHEGATPMIEALAVSPDGKLLATATYVDPAIRLWSLPTGRLLRELTVGQSASTTANLSFSLDGRLLARSGRGVPSTVWYTADGSVAHAFNEPAGADLRNMAFSPDGTLIAGVGNAPEIRLWRTTDFVEIDPIPVGGSYLGVTFASSDVIVTSAGEAWSVSARTRIAQPEHEASRVVTYGDASWATQGPFFGGSEEDVGGDWLVSRRTAVSELRSLETIGQIVQDSEGARSFYHVAFVQPQRTDAAFGGVGGYVRFFCYGTQDVSVPCRYGKSASGSCLYADAP